MKRGIGVCVAAVGALLLAPAAWAATITVGPTDDVQAAVDGAAAGDTIVLKPGTYVFTTTLTVSKQLNFKGAGKKTAVMLPAQTAPAITISDGVTGCTFTNIAFRFSSPAVYGGTGNDGTVFSKCIFSGGYSGLEIHGNDCAVSKCQFSGNNVGGRLYGTGQSWTGNRHLASYGYSGQILDGSGDFSKEAGDLGTDGSISYFSNSTGNATSGKYGRSYDCVYVDGGSMVLVSRNKGDLIYDYLVYLGGDDHESSSNQARHVEDYHTYVSGARGTVASNKGVFVEYGAYTTGDDCVVQGNQFSQAGCGVDMYNGGGSTTASATGNKLTDCWWDGIYTDSVAGLKIQGNQVTRTGSTGIGLRRSTGGMVLDNKLGDLDAATGIYVYACTNPTVQGNTVQGAGYSGIYVGSATWWGPAYNTTGAVVQDNTVIAAGNAYNGAIHAVDISASTIQGNTVRDSNGSGILLSGCDTVTVKSNQIQGALQDGILVNGALDVGQCVVDGNTVRDVDAEGIQNDATGSGTGTVIKNNTILGSGLKPLANSGLVNAGASTGNNPQPADWDAIAPQQFWND